MTTNCIVTITERDGDRHAIYCSHDGFIDVVGSLAKHFWQWAHSESCENNGWYSYTLGFGTFMHECGYSYMPDYPPDDGPEIMLWDSQTDDYKEPGYPWIVKMDFESDIFEAYELDEDDKLQILTLDEVPDLERRSHHFRGGTMATWLSKYLRWNDETM
jgi:hypothetical protein